MILILAEQHGGKFKKATMSAVTAGSQLARKMGIPCTAIVLGTAEVENMVRTK